MKIIVVSDAASLAFARSLVQNELGGQLSLVYKWSDADGVRTGKSGWSCGITQMDINNNPNALLMLRDLGYTTDESRRLRTQDPGLDMTAMNAKLLAARDVVDRYDRAQIEDCLTWPLGLCTAVDFSSEETFIHVADYHNQFGMSRGGKMHAWLLSINGSVTPEMVRDFKLGLPWGQKNPADVNRRYRNIVRVMRLEQD